MSGADSLAGQTPGALRWLYQFHDWARPRLLVAAERLDDFDRLRPGTIAGGNEDASLQAALAHILGAEVICPAPRFISEQGRLVEGRPATLK
jgi:hypothetical protein